MKKRIKILCLSSAVVLCFGLLLFSVLAMTSVSFNVTSTLNFEATNLNIGVMGYVMQGKSFEDAEQSTNEAYNYMGFTYTPDMSSDLPLPAEGSETFENFRNLEGADASSWNIGSVNFSSSKPYVAYSFLIINANDSIIKVNFDSNLQNLISDPEMSNVIVETSTVNMVTNELNSNLNIEDGLLIGNMGIYGVVISFKINNFLDNFVNKQFDLTLSFTYEKDQAEPTDYFVYSEDKSTITGLSDIYNSMLVKPETLTIPSTADDGLTSVTKIEPEILDVDISNNNILTTFSNMSSSNIIIEEGIEVLGTASIYNESVVSLSLPDTLLRIEEFAIVAPNLTSIRMSENIEYIGNSGISSITNLEKNTYDNAYYIGNENSPNIVLVDTINNNITSCDVDSDTKVILDYAFDNLTNLQNVYLNEGLKCIGKSAFSGCSNVMIENLPNSVQYIGDGAFYDCGNLSLTTSENIEYFGTVENPHMILLDVVDTTLSSYTINQNTKYISARAFENCTNFEYIDVPEGVLRLDTNAFRGCSDLREIPLPSTLEDICAYAFRDCTSLTTVELPDGLKKISEGAFYNCPELTFVTVTKSVSQIGYSLLGSFITNPISCFVDCPKLIVNVYEENPYYSSIEGCLYNKDKTILYYVRKDLTSYTIPDTVKTIGDYAFSNCTVLETVVIPDSVEIIGNYAFQKCQSLKNILIPRNVKEIGANAFIDSGLENAIFYSPNNWTAKLNLDGDSPQDVALMLTDYAQNATYLKTTYVDRYFVKK